MTFAGQLTSDLAVFFNTDEFAQSVTYGAGTITAIVQYRENPGAEMGTVEATAVLLVKASDVAAPAYRDAVVIGSATWYVEKVLRGDGYVWELALSRQTRPVLRR